MKSLFACLVLLACSLSSFAQSDAMHFGPNYVTVVARHCQKYQHESGHMFWKHTSVDSAACAADPSTVYMTHVSKNLDTNLAKDWSAFLMSGTSGLPSAGTGNFLALSVSGTVSATDCAASATPASSNCNMNGGASPGTYEISTSGLSRKGPATSPAVTFTRTGNGVYTLVCTWTAAAAQGVSSGTPNGTIASAGVVVGGTAGTGPVLFENTFTPLSMAIADTLQITWTITIT